MTLGFAEYRGTAYDETPVAEEVAKRLGTDHQTIWVHFELGDIFLKIDGATTEARKQYEQASTLAKQLAAAAADNAEAQRDLSISYGKFGEVQQEQGDSKAALASYQEGLKICQKLAAADPSSATAQRDLSISHSNIGDVQRAQGDGKAALAS